VLVFFKQVGFAVEVAAQTRNLSVHIKFRPAQSPQLSPYQVPQLL